MGVGSFSGQAFRSDGKGARRAAGGIIDVAVEDIGDLDERRILRLRAHLVRSDAVVEHAESGANRGLAVAEHVVGDADARTPVVVIGVRSARGQAHEQPLHRGIVGLRQAARRRGRECAAIDGDAVVTDRRCWA